MEVVEGSAAGGFATGALAGVADADHDHLGAQRHEVVALFQVTLELGHQAVLYVKDAEQTHVKLRPGGHRGGRNGINERCARRQVSFEGSDGYDLTIRQR